jgi:recombination protein RecR
MLPEVLEQVVSKLKEFPGLGTRSSRKLALDLLELEPQKYQELISSVQNMRDSIHFCSRCGFFAQAEQGKDPEKTLCSICNDGKRIQHQICVVEKPTDILLIERSENYRGTYFVLGGLISPLDNVFAEDTNISELFDSRLTEESIQSVGAAEVILFFRPGFNAEATTAYIKEKIASYSGVPITLSKLAQGLPLYYNPDTLDQATMSLALSDRREVV